MIRCLVGYLAGIMFLYLLVFKRLNKKLLKIPMKKLVKFHSLIGTLMICLIIVHVVMIGHMLTISLGTLCLILLFIIFGTGMIVAHIKSSNRRIFLYLHSGLSILTLICILVHIIENIILM